MALQKAILSIPMSLGIDVENAPALVDNNRFTLLSNAVFNKDNKGQLHKRPGHNQLGTAIQGGGVLPAAQLLAMFNDELSTIAGGNLYSYSPTSTNWALRGSPPTVQVQETNIAAGAFSVANPDVCLLNGLAYYIYEMNGDSWVKIVDDSNKSVKATIPLRSLIGASTFSPKILTVGDFTGSTGTGKVGCLSVDATGNLWFVLLTGTAMFSVTNLSSTIGALGIWFQGGQVTKPEAVFDAIISNPGSTAAALPLCIVYVAGSALRASSFNIGVSTVTHLADTTIAASLPLQPNAGLALSVTNVASGGASYGVLYVTWQASAGGIVNWQQYTSIDPWIAGSFGVIGSSALLPCPRLTTASVPSGSSAVLGVFYEQPAASSNGLPSITYWISGASVLWSTGCNIAGQPFVNRSNLYLPVIFPSGVQQSLFLTFQAISSTPANVLAQVAGRYYTENNAGSAPTNYRMAAPFNVTATTASLAAMVQPQGTSAASVAASLSELSLVLTSTGTDYLIPNDTNTIVHVSATDLANGTAGIGPAWTKVGAVPYSATPTPTPSVGPFGLNTYQVDQPAEAGNEFMLQAPNVLNISAGQSFCATGVIFNPPTPGALESQPVILTNGNNAEVNYWEFYPETDGPTHGDVGFYMQTASLSQELLDYLPYYELTGQLLVISCGYDGATNNLFLKVNNRTIITGNLGGSSQATTTSSSIGNFLGSNGNFPFNGNIYEIRVSLDTPSDALFTSIYNSVQASITTAPAQFSQLGGNLHLACGSQLMDYDGTNLVEHNFHVYPETPTLSYLTSQLTVITDGFDPNFQAPGGGVVQGSYRIMIPDNAASPGGPIGQLIQPGEYITFYADSSPTGTAISAFIVYFTVNGVGTAPTGVGSATTTACPIQSTMTASQIATALTTVITPLLTGFYTVSYTATAQTNISTPQTIKLTNAGVATQAAAPPMLSTVSDATQVYIGTFGTTPATLGLSFPAASLISTGQYCQFTSSSSFFPPLNKALIYVWFSNPNNAIVGNEVKTGGDPKPFGTLANGPSLYNGNNITWSSSVGPGNYIGVEVPLVGTETPVAVASLVATALNNVRTFPTASFNLGNGTFSATQQANTVCVQYNLTAAGQIVSSDFPATNVGQGYVGAVIDGSSQPYTAIEYCSVYEWIDSQNQLHQSAPSVPAIAYIPTYVTEAATVNNNIVQADTAVPVSAVIQVATRPLSLTQKTSAITGTDLDIAIYRTISGATVGNQVFYRITPTSSLLFNQPSALTAITYADYSSDGESISASSIGSVATGVQSNQLLYTTGGVQPNSAPPACSYVINHQNRLWLTGLENPNELWYSETLDPTAGQAVAFTQLQYALVNPTVGQTIGGAIVALASMDSNLIVFQENQIWYIQGSGPDPTGGNGFFTPPQIVASSSQIGCRDVNSVVLMPNGVMFKSTQGFWLLGRDLQLRYVGAAVKAYNADIVTSAVAIASNSQINFLSESGTTLMYDWYYDSWSTFTTTGVDSLIDGSGLFNMVTSSGAIWVQAPSQYIDGDGTPITMTIQTAWLKPSNVQGFQRIWKAFLEGYFYGAQPYLVQIAYNYSSTVTDSFPVNAGASSSIGTWGGSATWGLNVWGEDGSTSTSYPDQIQLRVFPSNQLCESIQFTIQDLAPVPLNQTWSLNALDLEIGLRSGGMKRIGNPQSLG